VHCWLSHGGSLRDWLSIWSAVGSVVCVVIGALLGSYLSSRGQRKQWIADNKKQEYRELLTTLTKAYQELAALNAPIVVWNKEDQQRYEEAIKRAETVILDRIFISTEVAEMNLVKRWLEVLQDTTHDKVLLAVRLNNMLEEIREKAMQAGN
jgi:dihydroorotase-like cyclic amidohydrolase